MYATFDVPLPKVLGTLNFSPLWSYDTGTPYGAAGLIDTNPYVTNPGYLTPPTTVTYYFTAVDAFRTDSISRLDLALNYSYFIGPVEIFVQPQVLNVLNEHGVQTLSTAGLAVDTGYSRSSGFNKFNPFTTTPKLGTRPATGQPKNGDWGYGPSFGKATAPANYQLARQFRVGFGVRF